MPGETKRGKSEFKDYCLILQVHPEADAGVIDAAYWHLAKRCNEAAPRDPQALEKLDDLNEAYRVLGSAERREAYMVLRTEVLGAGALPEAPPPVHEKPPLAIMERERPRARGLSLEPEPAHKAWAPSAVSSVLAIPFVLALAVATFLAGASPEIVAGLIIVGFLFMAVPLAPAIVRVRPSLPSVRVPVGRPAIRLSRRNGSATITPIDSPRLQASTKARAGQLRAHEAPQPRPLPPADAPTSTKARVAQLRAHKAAQPPPPPPVDDPRD